MSAGPYWLQWLDSEVQKGVNIDVSLGTIPGDTTVRTFITGLDQPRQTNFFYATDPSQQGSSVEFAYPYRTFPLAVYGSDVAPIATAPGADQSSATSKFDYASPVYVNSVNLSAAGTGYKAGDILDIPGGTIPTGLSGAQVKVTTVDAAGAITAIELYLGGFYTAGPSASGSFSGGTGTGATYDTLVTLTNTNFQTWVTTPYDNGAGSYGHFTANGTDWNIASGQGSMYIIYSSDSYGLSTAASFSIEADVKAEGTSLAPDAVLQFAGTYNGQSVFSQLDGPGVAFSVNDQTFKLYSKVVQPDVSGDQLKDTNLVSSVTGLTLAASTYYRISVTATADNSGTTPGFQIVATLALQSTPTTIIATVQGFVPFAGEQMAVGQEHRGPPDDGCDTFWRNIYVTSTAKPNTVTGEVTAYVTTYANVFDQESAPSPASNLITVYLNTSTTPNTFGPVTVTIDPDATNGATAEVMNLYRLVTATDGTATYTYVTTLAALNLPTVVGAFTDGETVTGSQSGVTGKVLSWVSPVLELEDVVGGVFIEGETVTGGTSGATGVYGSTALGTASFTYTDSALDSDLSGALQSATWTPPDPNMIGIIALPNGIMAGFILGTNTLCLSEANFPQAWPIGYQRTTDWPIVGIAVFANICMILTTGNPYTAYGNDPSQFFMNKEKAVQGCVSKRSIAVHKTSGVIYASGNGLCYYRGQGDLDLIRRQNVNGELVPLFTYEQWQTLNPSTIQGYVHNDMYFFWGTDTAGAKYGYILDLLPNGFGLVSVDVHVTCAFNDPPTDYLYLVPDKSTYPVNGSVISAASNVVSQWDYPASLVQRTKSWANNLMLAPWQTLLGFLRLRSATGYTGITVTVSNENGTIYNGAPPTTGDSFNGNGQIEPGMKYSLSITDTGSNTILDCEAAENVEELGP